MLENNFTSSVKLNNGYHVLGPGPIDDRTVVKDVESLYINPVNAYDCLLYNRAYAGMKISVFEDDETVSLYQLKDATPYTPNHVIIVDNSNFKDYWDIMNTTKIDKAIEDATYFHGDDLDDDLALLTDHGCLPKGKKVSELETMTISEILQKILFETATPKKTVSQTASISFKSPFNSVIEVGHELPTVYSFNYSYTPEKWNWVSKIDATVMGEEKSLSKFKEITYFYNETNKNTAGSYVTDGYSGKTATEGVNGYWYGIIAYDKYQDAIDSLNRTADDDGNVYAAAKEGMYNTPTITFTGAWRIHSNATMISTTNLWSHRNDEIGASDYKGAGAAISDIFCEKAKSVYMLFPKQTTDDDKFYIWVPATYKVSAVYGANNAVKDTFDISKTVGNPVTENIVCEYATGSYKKYTIEKSAGNTCVQVVIAKI